MRGTSHHTTRCALLWSGLTVVCLVGLVGARIGEDGASERERESAVARTIAAAEGVAAIVRQPAGSTALGFDPNEVLVLLQAEVSTDPSAARARLYGADSSLLFASDRVAGGQIGDPSDDEAVTAALEGDVGRRLTRARFAGASTGGAGPQMDLVQVFVPLRLPDGGVAGVVQVDYLADELRAMAAGSWPTIQLGLGIALLVCLGMAVVAWVPLHDRDDEAENGTVPTGQYVVPADPRALLEHLAARARVEARGGEDAAPPEESGTTAEGADLRARLTRAVDMKMLRDVER